jgi:hypothetical protein
MSKGGDHSIVVSTKALPPLEEQDDGPLYVHFLPRKEYLEAGTPWIIHSKYGCHPVAHVQFESIQCMTTGEGQPPVAVCNCGVSNHHLQVRARGERRACVHTHTHTHTHREREKIVPNSRFPPPPHMPRKCNRLPQRIWERLPLTQHSFVNARWRGCVS